MDKFPQSDLYAGASALFGQLRLPEVELKLRPGKSSAKLMDVYDTVRRKWVALTPEEWVRQHFVAFMVSSLGYDALRIANEVSLEFNGMKRRADTVVYDDRLYPMVVVEYKASGVPLSGEVLQQVLRYNQVYNAPALMVTNGLDVWSIDARGELFRGVIRACDIPGSRDNVKKAD